jgi:hypothetical protein
MADSEKRYYGEFLKLFIHELLKFSVDSEDFGFSRNERAKMKTLNHLLTISLSNMLDPAT